MNTICSQCGSVLATSERRCCFCDSTLVPTSKDAERRAYRTRATASSVDKEWRGELNDRVQAYRAKRRKSSGNEAQHALPFDGRGPSSSEDVAVDVNEAGAPRAAPGDGFAFTIAIGRSGKQSEPADPRVLIDVSVPPEPEGPGPEAQPLHDQPGLYCAAPVYDRRRALMIDAACLAFAYGGFLTLFGSLGGHFALNKLSAAVYFFAFAFVYLQYFGLFTIFGGSTPGMMICGLQVASFTGDVPTPRQYSLRAVGYLLSAGTCFLGFLWVFWDEDSLTWHDRLSRTYLARLETFVENDMSHPATAG